MTNKRELAHMAAVVAAAVAADPAQRETRDGMLYTCGCTR